LEKIFRSLPGKDFLKYSKPMRCLQAKIPDFQQAGFDALVKSLISDGAVKSSRSRLAQFLKNFTHG
jgi:hypothetical protein